MILHYGDSGVSHDKVPLLAPLPDQTRPEGRARAQSLQKKFRGTDSAQNVLVYVSTPQTLTSAQRQTLKEEAVSYVKASLTVMSHDSAHNYKFERESIIKAESN